MRLRPVETVVLVVVGAVLTAAVLVAATKRAETRESFRRDGALLTRFATARGDRALSRPRFSRYTDHDVACATLGAGGSVRVCVQLSRRPVHIIGGWRQAALAPSLPARRGCFGLARHRGMCAPRAAPR